jgi:hypothetical protein
MSNSAGKPVGEVGLFDGLGPEERNGLVADRVFGKAELRGRPFSTDILTAMLVVERVSDEGFSFKCNVGPDGRAQVSFLAKDGSGVANVQGSSLPVAICNAALEIRRRNPLPGAQS